MLFSSFRIVEARYSTPDVITGRKTVDASETIQALLRCGALPDSEQATLEEISK
jgi:hypothetical protein